MQDSSEVDSRPRLVTTELGRVPVRPRGHCPACGAASGSAPANGYSRPPWSIRDCPACRFVYLDPVPQYEALSKTLAWDDSAAKETARKAKANPVRTRVSEVGVRKFRFRKRFDAATVIARHAAPGNVIDVGCSHGGRVRTLPEHYVPYGIEIGAKAAAAAKKLMKRRKGRCLHAPALTGLRTFPDGFFTGAILRSYLEHEVHPAEVLAELARTLVPGGVAVIKVPNYASVNRRITGKSWCGFRFPDHVNYFTPASLRGMADRAGFDIEYGWLGMLPISDNMWALLRRR